MDQSVENKLLWIDNLGGLDCKVKNRASFTWKQSTITFAISALTLECQNCKYFPLNSLKKPQQPKISFLAYPSGDKLFLQYLYKEWFYCKCIRAIPVWGYEEWWNIQLIYIIRISGELTRLHSSSLEEEGSIHILFSCKRISRFLYSNCGSAEPAKYLYISPWRLLASKSYHPQVKGITSWLCISVVPQSTC